METLKDAAKVIGLKQSLKAVRSGRAAKVFLASDADERRTREIREAARELGVPLDSAATMAELGKASGIAVGAAAVALLAAR